MPKDDPGKANGGFKGFGGANADKLGRFDAGNLGNHGNGKSGDQTGQGGQNGSGEMNGKATGNEKSGGNFNDNNGNASGQGQANGDAMARETAGDNVKSQGGLGDKPSAGGQEDTGGGTSSGKFGGQSGDALSSLNKGIGGFGQTGIGDEAGDQAKDSLQDALKGDPVDDAFNGQSDQKDAGNDMGVNDQENPDLANDLKGAAEDGKGLPAGLKNLGNKLPEPVKKAGGKAGQAYAKFNGAAVKQVMKFGGKGGMKQKIAQAIVHAILGTTVGIGGFAAYQIFDSQQQPYDSSFVCTTTNNSGNAFEVDDNANSNPALLGSGPTSSQNSQQENAIKLYGNYQDKNSNAHKIYEMIYADLLREGLDKTQAAGIAGGVVQEDGVMDPIQGNIGGKPGGGSDGGFGFFQVTPSVSGHNLQDYANQDDHKVNLFANSSITLNGDDPKDRAKAMIGMEDKVRIEVQEYVEDFVKPGNYLKYKGTYQRMAELGAELEAHGTVGYGTADNSNVMHRTAGARFVMENYSNLPDLQNIGGKVDSADANAANAEQANNDACNTAGNTDNGNNGTIIDTAKEFIGKVPYDQPNRATITSNPIGGEADCSSFVWYVFKMVGYKVPDQPWNTASMVSDASKPYVELVSAQNARKGDAFVINKGDGLRDNGHTGILLQDWHGPNTMVINEGGSQMNVNISTFGEACYPTLTGGKIQFVRPYTLNK